VIAPPVGVLEELDGGRIGPRSGPAHATPWPRAMAAATRLAAGRPRLWAFALLAFLARGGLVALVIPMLVLPSFIGIANTVGPTSVTAAGPTPRLVALIAAWCGIALAAIVGGTLLAAAAEVALHRATVTAGTDGAMGRGVAFPSRWVAAASPQVSGTPPARGVVRRVAVARLVLIVPVALALVAAVPGWVGVAYQELLLPSDLAIPLPLRVIAGAPIAAIVVVAAWLLAEVIGGLAARRIVLDGSTVPGAIGAAAGEVARAPASALLTLGLSLAGTLPVLVPAVVVVGLAWDRARIALVDATDGAAVIVSTLVLVVAWAACLGVAGVAAAWRSALWTAELARRETARLNRRDPGEPGLDARATLEAHAPGGRLVR
jgi:hypothetical protein